MTDHTLIQLVRMRRYLYRGAVMEEAEWLSSTDPQKMLNLPDFEDVGIPYRYTPPYWLANLISDPDRSRELRLIAAGANRAYRKEGPLLPDLERGTSDIPFTPQSHRKHDEICELAERMADGGGPSHPKSPYTLVNPRAWYGVLQFCRNQYRHQVVADVVRDVLGNPWRQAVISDVPVAKATIQYRPDVAGVTAYEQITIPRIALTNEVVGCAKAIYEDNDFGLIPILIDALIDAGMPDPNGPLRAAHGGPWVVMNHLRSGKPHVKGCWVVDLILGKR